METLKNIVLINVAFIAISLIASGLGAYFTEYRRPLFAFKPFSCRPCLSFWLALVLGLVLAALPWRRFADYEYIEIAQLPILYAFIVYLFTKSQIKIDV